VALLQRAGDVGRRHGVGIVDHIEDRVVGLKVRDLYEIPAATMVLTAHRELERLVSTIHQNNFKRSLEEQWAYLCYAGLWHDPLRGDLDAYMDSANAHVEGEVTLKLYKGSATVVARTSPWALYDRSLASFGESGGEFSQSASPGFIELFTLQSRLAHQLHHRLDEADADDEASN
jgi:argininosuccinate synthase